VVNVGVRISFRRWAMTRVVICLCSLLVSCYVARFRCLRTSIFNPSSTIRFNVLNVSAVTWTRSRSLSRSVISIAAEWSSNVGEAGFGVDWSRERSPGKHLNLSDHVHLHHQSWLLHIPALNCDQNASSKYFQREVLLER